MKIPTLNYPQNHHGERHSSNKMFMHVLFHSSSLECNFPLELIKLAFIAIKSTHLILCLRMINTSQTLYCDSNEKLLTTLMKSATHPT